MISVVDLSLQFGSRKLFDDVNLKFTSGNCYGVIGANGAGKSTFLKILSGEIDDYSGKVILEPRKRIAVLKQDHYEYDDFEVLDAIMKAHTELYTIMDEKNAIYMKSDFSEEDGIRAAELEERFEELGGWEAESDAIKILIGLDIEKSLHHKKLKELDEVQKIKVLLAQALFGNPDVLLLDEPTNYLDMKAINWLENFLLNFDNTVIVVSHDRHFLNKVCTHMVDVDYGKIKQYVGNYDFWYESSQLALQLSKNQNKKREEKIKALKDFIARFSANASKSKQATSRKKSLAKLTLEDIKPSTRRYPFIGFSPEREAGNNLLTVENLSKTIDGEKILDNISFTVHTNDKTIFLSNNEKAKTLLFQILSGEIEPDEGVIKWGITTSRAYFPKDNNKYFENNDEDLVEWLRKFSITDQSEIFIRGFLGRVLFSGEEAKKKISVLSGGEKVRCMFAKLMLSNANVLLLDEPTNHLDLESITAVNNGVKAFKGTIFLIENDHQFIQTICNKVVILTKTGAINKDITFDEYLEDEELQKRVAEMDK